MLKYIIRRIGLMIPTLFIVSIVSFVIIEAPPGDFVTAYIGQLQAQGVDVDPQLIETLRARYGVDEPLYIRYFKWLSNLIHGDLGTSMEWNRPVTVLLAERLPWSMSISFVSLVFVYAVGIPIGVISAVYQYSIRDYIFTVLGFFGLAIPNFLFALLLLWLLYVHTGNVAIGLFSEQYQLASWSIAKVIDLFKHLWIPAIIVGTAGTARLIRIMRANLLDELQKPYVMVARTKGLSETKVLFRYPFRIAINPIVSTIGWTLPILIEGEVLVSIVLGIPTIAPVLLGALKVQDMYLAGSIIFILTFLTIIGTLISDILLAWIDPRLREAV